MKSRRIFKETYISDNISNTKISISPKEETYISKYSNYKSIKKYTKKDVDMIIKIQRWWKSILPKLNKYKKLDNSNSKRSVESLRVRHYSNSSISIHIQIIQIVQVIQIILLIFEKIKIRNHILII